MENDSKETAKVRPNYRIFKLSDDRKKKICDSEVYLETEEQIIVEVDKLRESTGIEFYWEPIHYIGLIGKDHKIEMEKNLEFSYSNEYLGIDDDEDDCKKESVWKRFLDSITSIPYKVEQGIPTVKYAIQRALFKYDRTVPWNIGHNVIDLLKKNLPKMINGLTGCPTEYCIKSKMLLKNISKEVATRQFEKNDMESHVETEVAVGLWKGELLELLDKCKLLGYYMDAGIQYGLKIGDPDWVDPRKHPIPMKKNSFQPDYNKLKDLFTKTNDEVFGFLREHWTEMWD